MHSQSSAYRDNYITMSIVGDTDSETGSNVCMGDGDTVIVKQRLYG